ncbi:phosphoribosylglycinamide formyltransferase [Dokdonella sp.]|uniref:phosphoribosylglycinamide formyltransferase n=1 Tax=Dokdonella sp. TaxID=2291710 RepID=UPI003527E430
MKAPMRVVVLASGRGSNLQALIDAQRDGRLPIRIVGVLSDKPSARALELAAAAGIPAFVCDPREATDRLAYDRSLFARIEALEAELVVLAGFMRILDPRAFAPWLGRIINIHPSLLPLYPGLHTHRRALEAGETRHGASVHFVTADLDGGPVIAQVGIDILAGDTAQNLADRLLPLEHRLLVRSVGMIASGRLCWSSGVVCLDSRALNSPLVLEADDSLAIRPE